MTTNGNSSKDIYLNHKTQGEFELVWRFFEELCDKINIKVNLSLVDKCQPLPNDFGLYTIIPRKALFNCSEKQFSAVKRELLKESKARQNSIGLILTTYYGCTTAFWCWILLPYVFTMTAFSEKPSRLEMNMILFVLVMSYVETVFADKGWIQLKPEVIFGKSTYRLLFLACCSLINGFLEISAGLPLLLFIWSFSSAVRSALSLIRYSELSDWLIENNAFVHGTIQPLHMVSGLQTHFFKFSLPVCSISEIWCCQELLLTLQLGRFISTVALMSTYGTFCVVYFTIYTMYSEEAADKSNRLIV